MIQMGRVKTGFYVVGGTMEADAPSYIERKADTELYEHILAGDFCYVLTPRQMGKSSLMARTSSRLEKQGFRVANVDLSFIGQEKKKASADIWYNSFLDCIVKELAIKVNLDEWWDKGKNLTLSWRLIRFFSDVVLLNEEKNVVIFIDEIDTTIGLPFVDDFIAVIRSCYNARATKAEFNRLSFVLMGVASPSDLIKDTRRTPFNIGHRIDLNDFTFEEAKLLSRGLGLDDKQAEKALKHILYWTGGHPYLTQNLCRLVANEKLKTYSDGLIDSIVEKNLLAPKAIREDANLSFINNRIVRSSEDRKRIPKLYQKIYQNTTITDEPLSPTHTELKLTGLIIVDEKGYLKIRNPIYKRVFEMEWVKALIPSHWERNVIFASYAILLLFVFLSYTLFTGNKAGVVRSWQVKTGRSVGEPIKQESEVTAIELSSDVDTLITGNKAGVVRLWQIKTGLLLDESIKQESEVTAIKLSSDGNTLFIGDKAGLVRLMQLKTGRLVEAPIQLKSEVTAIELSSDGRTLITGDRNRRVQLWQIDKWIKWEESIEYDSWARKLTFTPDRKTLIIATENCLHQASLEQNPIRLNPKASRKLPGKWTGAYRFMDEKGGEMQIAVRGTGDSSGCIKVYKISFDILDIPPIQGDPDKLLRELQKSGLN